MWRPNVTPCFRGGTHTSFLPPYLRHQASRRALRGRRICRWLSPRADGSREDLLSAVEEMNDPHISTEMHRLSASVAQVVHVLRATLPEKTALILREFDKLQLRLSKRLLPYILDLPAAFVWQASLNLEDGGLRILTSRVVAVSAQPLTRHTLRVCPVKG